MKTPTKARVLCVSLLFSIIYTASGETLKTDSPKNAITIEPIDLIWKTHLSYEHVLNNKYSVGIGALYYYQAVPYWEPETKADIFFRYYYKSINYMQPMISAGESLAFKGKTIGGSVSCGFKRVFLKSHIAMDVSGGLQIYAFYYPNDAFGALAWYAVGPGAIFLFRIAAGYAF